MSEASDQALDPHILRKNDARRICRGGTRVSASFDLTATVRLQLNSWAVVQHLPTDLLTIARVDRAVRSAVQRNGSCNPPHYLRHPRHWLSGDRGNGRWHVLGRFYRQLRMHANGRKHLWIGFAMNCRLGPASIENSNKDGSAWDAAFGHYARGLAGVPDSSDAVPKSANSARAMWK
jgi:hypothetical protein